MADLPISASPHRYDTRLVALHAVGGRRRWVVTVVVLVVGGAQGGARAWGVTTSNDEQVRSDS